jgi:hypothetical protein
MKPIRDKTPKGNARFAALPERALGDLHLNRTDLVALGYFALRARGSKQGCYERVEDFAKALGVNYTNVSVSVSKLMRLGYVRRERWAQDRRRWAYHVVYSAMPQGVAVPQSDMPQGIPKQAECYALGQKSAMPSFQENRAGTEACLSQQTLNRPKRNNRPRRADAQLVLAELEKVLDQTRARAVVDHRRKLNKPLTPYAAKLLATSLGRSPTPNAAADTMIERGWQGFNPEWAKGTPAGKPKVERMGGIIIKDLDAHYVGGIKIEEV